MTEGIYDEKEFQKALAWAKENCKLGFDKNPEVLQKSRRGERETVRVRCKDGCYRKRPDERQSRTCRKAARKRLSDTMQSQLVSRDRDSGRTSIRTATSQRHVLNTSFDWNGAREPYILATENDVLNGLGMLFMKLLTNRAQIFADVRTYWSPEAVQESYRLRALEGVAEESRRLHSSDQLRRQPVWMPAGRQRMRTATA